MVLDSVPQSCRRGMSSPPGLAGRHRWLSLQSNGSSAVATGNHSSPHPAVNRTPGPAVSGTPRPAVRRTPGPAVNGTPGPAVNGTPGPAVNGTPGPAVRRSPGPAVHGSPRPAVNRTPGLAARGTPRMAVRGTPGPAVHGSPRPAVCGSLGCDAPPSRRSSACSLHSGTWLRGTMNSGGRMRSSGSLPSISTQKANLKKSVCLLLALRPANLQQERDKFFLTDYTHNPQFQYEDPPPLSMQEKYSQSSDQFLVQALRILNAVIGKYGSYENFESVTGGKLLRKSQIWSCCRRYMQKEGCSGEVVVQLTEDLLSQAVMTTENSRPTLTINLLGARQHWLEGVLRHEIGTHYLRGVNDGHQPWHGSEGRKQFGLQPANPTEEGLASLHSVLFRKHPYLWRAALLYYTVSRAAALSFCDLFRDLQQFVEEPAVRWEYCVRAKRGQRDTSQPGCFSKDQVYLDGIIRILRYRQSIDFRLLTSLGKVSFEDAEGLLRFADLADSRLPHFMGDMQRYQQQLSHIMATNLLSDEELHTLLPEGVHEGPY